MDATPQFVRGTRDVQATNAGFPHCACAIFVATLLFSRRSRQFELDIFSCSPRVLFGSSFWGHEMIEHFLDAETSGSTKASAWRK